MIDTDYARIMARYNLSQNRNLLTAADTLTPEARALDRGAFFGTIDRTFAHLLWADLTWLGRFTGTPGPGGGIAAASAPIADWEAFKAARAAADARILA